MNNLLLAIYAIVGIGVFIKFYLLDDMWDDDLADMAFGAFMSVIFAAAWPVFILTGLLFAPFVLLKLAFNWVTDR